MSPVPETFSELRIGVLMIFAEAQAWAHNELTSALAERRALSARAHNRGRVSARRQALSSTPSAVRNRARRAQLKKEAA